MSNAQRLVLLAGAVLVIVVGFVVLSPGGSDNSGNQQATTAATTPTAAAPEPAPPTATIQVRGGKPAGGAKTVTVRKGDRVTIVVGSPDTTAEIHLHGYDVKRGLKAGGRVRFSFTATAEGIFEMELEQTETQIAKLEVRPS